MGKGTSGSVRMDSLGERDLTAMENHERRRDRAGQLRSVRKGGDGEPIPPLLYDPYETGTGDDCLTAALAQHVEGARVNKGASKVCRHAFIQFPTDLEITEENEKMMLQQAVDFVNKTHGGNAVFRARLDRDEEGRHGVDVFFAPKYQKTTKRGSTTWISLTKFGKELALERFGHKPKMVEKNGKVTESTTETVPCDGAWYQGKAYQAAWFEHLRDECKLDWITPPTEKIGRDPDRLEPEEYKLSQERKKLEAERHELTKREEALVPREAALKSREEAAAKAEQKTAKTQEWLARAAGNLRSAINLVLTDRYEKTPTAVEMGGEVKLNAFTRVAKIMGHQATFGFRTRFWTLNYSDTGNKVEYFDDKTHENLNAAFDKIDAFAKARKIAQERDRALQEREAAVEGVEERLKPLRASEAALTASVDALKAEKEELEAILPMMTKSIEKREQNIEAWKTKNLSVREAFFESGFSTLVRAIRKHFNDDSFQRIEQAYKKELEANDPPSPAPKNFTNYSSPSR